jgi:hypothetical protein
MNKKLIMTFILLFSVFFLIGCTTNNDENITASSSNDKVSKTVVQNVESQKPPNKECESGYETALSLYDKISVGMKTYEYSKVIPIDYSPPIVRPAESLKWTLDCVPPLKIITYFSGDAYAITALERKADPSFKEVVVTKVELYQDGKLKKSK